MDDAKRLNKQLGNNDRHKVDEYLTAVREMEQRIEKAEKMSKALPDSKPPAGVPGGLQRAHPLDVRPHGAGVPD